MHEHPPGPNERAALERERVELMQKPQLSPMEARRLDVLDRVLGPAKYHRVP